LQFLKKRYQLRYCEIVIQCLKFPAQGTFEDYCRTIESFIQSDVDRKRILGFKLFA